MDVELKVFREMRSILVESIWWDARTDELVWVDITAGTLHRGRINGPADGSGDRVVELPPPVSAVQPRIGGGYIAALRDSIVLLTADGDIEDTLAHVEHAHPGIRFNEGKVDPFGRFIVGAMNVTGTAPDAALYSFDSQGRTRTMRGGFGVANGFEWCEDDDRMLVTDTSTQTVYAAPYGEAGDLGEMQPLLFGHASDGLTFDRDGTLWNGVYGDGRVLRWSAEGTVIDDFAVPAPNVTSVAFGANDLDTLFIGTARENLDEQQLADHPLSGSIFCADVGTTGRPVHTFGTRRKE